MIDIIIPTYNSSRKIISTLDSILNQTIADKISVYVIDDCSSEDYSDVCNFFSKYLNITLLRLDKNSGPGVARQYGLEHSNNEFIVFIDSDDVFYENNSVEILFDKIQNYDMAFSRMYNETIDRCEYHEGCLHGKMYRRSFLKKYDIGFNDLRSHEDNAFNQVCLSVAKIVHTSNITYNYRCNKNSITNSQNEIDSMKNYIASMTWALKKISSFDDHDLNNGYVAIYVLSIILYCYFNYLVSPENFEFIFDKLDYIKKMYYKYINFIPKTEYVRVYNNFHYNVIPNLTIDEFLKKIDK